MEFGESRAASFCFRGGKHGSNKFRMLQYFASLSSSSKHPGEFVGEFNAPTRRPQPEPAARDSRSWPRDGGKGLNKYHSVAISISSSSVHSPLPELPSLAKFVAIKPSLVDSLQPHHHQQATNLFEHTPVRAIPCRRRSPCPCFCPPYGR